MQLKLFDSDNRLPLVVAGLVASIKAAMNRDAAACGMSREQIADRMNEISQAAGVRLTQGNSRSISPALLEKWLSPAEREHVPSLIAVNVFCLAVGRTEALAAQLAAHGCAVMTDEDRSLRDYGRACDEARKAAKTKRKMEENLS